MNAASVQIAHFPTHAISTSPGIRAFSDQGLAVRWGTEASSVSYISSRWINSRFIKLRTKYWSIREGTWQQTFISTHTQNDIYEQCATVIPRTQRNGVCKEQVFERNGIALRVQGWSAEPWFTQLREGQILPPRAPTRLAFPRARVLEKEIKKRMKHTEDERFLNDTAPEHCVSLALAYVSVICWFWCVPTSSCVSWDELTFCNSLRAFNLWMGWVSGPGRSRSTHVANNELA